VAAKKSATLLFMYFSTSRILHTFSVLDVFSQILLKLVCSYTSGIRYIRFLKILPCRSAGFYFRSGRFYTKHLLRLISEKHIFDTVNSTTDAFLNNAIISLWDLTAANTEAKE